jgi:hypothetical protein
LPPALPTIRLANSLLPGAERVGGYRKHDIEAVAGKLEHPIAGAVDDVEIVAPFTIEIVVSPQPIDSVRAGIAHDAIGIAIAG